MITEGFSPTVEKFFHYSTEDVMAALFKSSESSSKQLIYLKECSHYHQTDAICIVPIEVFVKTRSRTPQTNVADIYLLNTQAVMLFLHQIGLSNSFDYSRLERRVSKLGKKFLDYHVDELDNENGIESANDNKESEPKENNNGVQNISFMSETQNEHIIKKDINIGKN